MHKPLILIINSSTFGRYFKEHLETLEQFADIQSLHVPSDISPDDLTDKIKNADGIIASVTPKFTRQTLEKCPKLILLGRHGIGCDNVDLEAATEQGIMVSRVKGIVERESVAEYAIGLLLAGSRLLPHGYLAVKNSRWHERSTMVGMELKGKTIGIIGLGNIGSRSAEILSMGFQAKVIATDPYISTERFKQYNATPVSLSELIQNSDAILFHCPLTAETGRMIGQPEINQMKKHVVIVNTCRGELLDETALYEGLQQQLIGAYATDVVESEPIDEHHRLARLSNVIITPHLGGYSWESLKGMGQTCVDDMISIFKESSIPGELANPEVLQKKYRTWL